VTRSVAGVFRFSSLTRLYKAARPFAQEDRRRRPPRSPDRCRTQLDGNRPRRSGCRGRRTRIRVAVARLTDAPRVDYDSACNRSLSCVGVAEHDPIVVSHVAIESQELLGVDVGVLALGRGVRVNEYRSPVNVSARGRLSSHARWSSDSGSFACSRPASAIRLARYFSGVSTVRSWFPRTVMAATSHALDALGRPRVVPITSPAQTIRSTVGMSSRTVSSASRFAWMSR